MRAPRFPLRLPVRYRPADGPDWQNGETENISRSGALMRVDGVLQVDTAVEVRLVLPSASESGAQHAEVACRGRVVRTVPPDQDEMRPGFAVAIDFYDFLPPTDDSSPTLSL